MSDLVGIISKDASSYNYWVGYYLQAKIRLKLSIVNLFLRLGVYLIVYNNVHPLLLSLPKEGTAKEESYDIA